MKTAYTKRISKLQYPITITGTALTRTDTRRTKKWCCKWQHVVLAGG